MKICHTYADYLDEFQKLTQLSKPISVCSFGLRIIPELHRILTRTRVPIEILVGYTEAPPMLSTEYKKVVFRTRQWIHGKYILAGQRLVIGSYNLTCQIESGIGFNEALSLTVTKDVAAGLLIRFTHHWKAGVELKTQRLFFK